MDFHVATKLFKESAAYGGPHLTTEKAATEEDDDRTGDSGMGTGSSGMGTGSGSIPVEDRKHGDWSPNLCICYTTITNFAEICYLSPPCSFDTA